MGFQASDKRWAGYVRSMLAVLVIAGAVAVLAVAVRAVAARAGQTARPAAASATHSRLGGLERAALAVGSIRVTAAQSVGLVVTVGFRGNVERYLGRGNLTHGFLALAIVPRGSGAVPAGVLDGDGGFKVARLPTVTRHNGRLITSTTAAALFGSERVLRAGSVGQAGAVRYGNHIIFYLPGLGLGQAASVKLKAFASGFPAAGGSLLPRSQWSTILARTPAGAASAPVSEANCAGLAATRRSLAAVIASALEPELRDQQRLRREVSATITSYRGMAGGGPRLTMGTLAGYRTSASRRIARLSGAIASLQGLVGRLDAANRSCATSQVSPPAGGGETAPPTTSATPATATPATSTTPSTSPTPEPGAGSPVKVTQTDSGQSQYMAPQPDLAFSNSQPQGVPVIDVNEQVRYQQFAGLGAAMTDSSAWLIYNKLSASARLALMQDLFGSAGATNSLGAPPIHLNFLRVAMGASGAMTVGPPYSYDDNNNQADPTLASFSIGHDEPYIVPTLQQALSINRSLQILANPWSPPAWMKSNDSLGNSNASGSLLTSYYDAYAHYFVKFIQAYQGYGIPVAAITPANEPTSGSGGSPYPGLNLPEANEAQFISQYLQPALSSAGLHPKIYGNDLSWDQLSGYAAPLAADPKAGPALSGTAWHCYFGSPTAMGQLQQQHPGMDQIVDECSPEIRSFGTPEFLISTLRNWATVDAIWSVALDPSGQPIQAGNHCGGCRGAVSIDQTTGAVTFRPEYYQLGQISAFVQPGAARIDSPTLVTYGVNASNIETVSSGLDDVAFLNPDGSKVLIAYNNSNAAISFGVSSDNRYYEYTIPAQAMTTFVWH